MPRNNKAYQVKKVKKKILNPEIEQARQKGLTARQLRGDDIPDFVKVSAKKKVASSKFDWKKDMRTQARVAPGVEVVVGADESIDHALERFRERTKAASTKIRPKIRVGKGRGKPKSVKRNRP